MYIGGIEEINKENWILEDDKIIKNIMIEDIDN